MVTSYYIIINHAKLTVNKQKNILELFLAPMFKEFSSSIDFCLISVLSFNELIEAAILSFQVYIHLDNSSLLSIADMKRGIIKDMIAFIRLPNLP